MKIKNLFNIALIGLPGAGKSTQATILCEKYNLHHIRTGDNLRKQIEKNEKIGPQIKSAMTKGVKIPYKVCLDHLAKDLEKVNFNKEGFLIDALVVYPKTKQQINEFQEVFNKLNVKIDALIEFKIEDDLVINRLKGRLVHKPSGRSYHEIYNPPNLKMLDDKTGEPLERRIDDNLNAIKQRLEIYHRETEPLISFYKKNCLHKLIDASQDIISISSQIDSFIVHLTKENRSNKAFQSYKLN